MKDDSDIFARELKRSAEKSSPEFSELLHQRVMRRIKTSPGRSEKDSHFHWQAIAALAAILLLAVSAWKFWPVEKSRPAPTIAAKMPELPSMGDVLAGTTGPLEQGFTDAGVDLNRDAVSLARFVADQLDVVPSGTRHGGNKNELRMHEGT